MDRDTAALLVNHYLRICAELNQMTHAIGALPNSDDQKRFRRPVGQFSAGLYVDLIVPLIKQFPDLDPDRNEGSNA
ncbi:MAG TPA: hypothetical protein VH814_09765 [Steroidobacteraceae bacterium]|jgi:hypothetical protein